MVVRVHRGCSGNLFLSNVAMKQFLYSKFNITTMDMESAAVALVCRQQKTPFTALRAVSGGGSVQSKDAIAIFMPLASENVVNVLVRFISLLSVSKSGASNLSSDSWILGIISSSMSSGLFSDTWHWKSMQISCTLCTHCWFLVVTISNDSSSLFSDYYNTLMNSKVYLDFFTQQNFLYQVSIIVSLSFLTCSPKEFSLCSFLLKEIGFQNLLSFIKFQKPASRNIAVIL